MRLPTAAIAILSFVPFASAGAKPAATRGTAVLRQGADALIRQAASQSGQAGNTDASQGAAHAAARAIQVVCSKDTPAAQRSAICRPNSPF
nr:hypothetical protein [Sphingomonas sp.]